MTGFNAEAAWPHHIKAGAPLSSNLLRTSENQRRNIKWTHSKLLHRIRLTGDEIPQIKIGDTVKVSVKIREGERERIQAFEGTVIARKGSGVSETFTVRRVSYGVGVERVFPVHSPNVAKVELIRSGKVRRSKLYYLRDRVGKAARVKSQVK